MTTDHVMLSARVFAAASVLCVLIGCSETRIPVASVETTPCQGIKPTTLRVALFPYIPDSGKDNYASLEGFIKTAFKKTCPQIDLSLRHLDQADDFYKLDTLKQWLSSGEGADAYDLVEIDTVLLGDVVAAGLVSPWRDPPNRSDWLPVAERAVRISEAMYGVPHLLCGYFLFSRDMSVANAASVDELSQALGNLKNVLPKLVGDLTGSWDMPSLFLDGWEDSHPGVSPAYALTRPLDADVLERFKTFSRLCEHQGANPCLDGTFHQNRTQAAVAFATGNAHALIGYSERLHLVLEHATDSSTILISSAPIGDGRFPVLFTDAFVLRSGAEQTIVHAAEAFAGFMNSPPMQEALMMSADATRGANPRYLIPATKSAFETPALRHDHYYVALSQAITRAVPFPVTGLLNMREGMRAEINAYLAR